MHQFLKGRTRERTQNASSFSAMPMAEEGGTAGAAGSAALGAT